MQQNQRFEIEFDDTRKERWELCFLRLQSIHEDQCVKEPYATFFKKEAEYLLSMEELVESFEKGEWKGKTLEELQRRNQALFAELLPENYGTCYGNPEYACKIFGEEIGKLLSFLYTELRALVVYAFEKRRYDMLLLTELFLEIYMYFSEEETVAYSQSLSAIRYFMSDYCDYLVGRRVSEMMDPSHTFATDIVMNADLSSPEYLYQYGEYISENEIAISKFLASLPQDQIDAMARTYTEGFRMGFVNNNMDLSKKNSVNIRFSIGFERMVRAAILQFKEMGLAPILFRSAVSSINKRGHLKVGYYATSVNRQFDYDHRFDDALYMNKAMIAKKLEKQRAAYEQIKDIARGFAGPAVIEIFGETPYEPVAKKEALSLSEKQQELQKEYQRDSALIVNEYVPRDEYSFTIIAYPIPEIGEKFEEIFSEIVKVNTLDATLYRNIQQCMIDVLDQGEKVHIVGSGKNKTDLLIALPKILHPEKETNFENCLADVNIPVGEVFTSPQLKGTTGHFHVTEVFLNELRYVDLELTFVDGMITEYTCKNFEDEEENKKFVKENLLYHRETLPMGEFAIGTNTYAYRCGKKYNISHLLPILIAEKTGPHFAVGDTCYKMSEEIKIYNPDGKEVVARDNECSILRKTDVNSAYFNCHTDITIPYDELKEITVITPSGEGITIIEDGRFVLPGTEPLNVPLDSDL